MQDEGVVKIVEAMKANITVESINLEGEKFFNECVDCISIENGITYQLYTALKGKFHLDHTLSQRCCIGFVLEKN